MPFTPRQYDSGDADTVQLENSQNVSKGDALIDSGGYYLRATGGNSTVNFVAAEDGSSDSSSNPDILVYDTEGIEFEVDTDANPARANIGTQADLKNASTLDPDATTNNVFFIKDIVGSTSDNKVRGKFVTSL